MKSLLNNKAMIIFVLIIIFYSFGITFAGMTEEFNSYSEQPIIAFFQGNVDQGYPNFALIIMLSIIPVIYGFMLFITPIIAILIVGKIIVSLLDNDFKVKVSNIEYYLLWQLTALGVISLMIAFILYANIHNFFRMLDTY